VKPLHFFSLNRGVYGNKASHALSSGRSSNFVALWPQNSKTKNEIKSKKKNPNKIRM
jgi:hypothetical protein